MPRRLDPKLGGANAPPARPLTGRIAKVSKKRAARAQGGCLSWRNNGYAPVVLCALMYLVQL